MEEEGARWCRLHVSINNFEGVSHIGLVSSIFTLSIYLPISETQPGHPKTCKMESFATIANRESRELLL